MVPPPPGLFSTTAVWLRRVCKPDAISRATTSLEPPGVNGTMMRSILLGNVAAGADGCCARAASAKAKQDIAPTRMAMNTRCEIGKDP